MSFLFFVDKDCDNINCRQYVGYVHTLLLRCEAQEIQDFDATNLGFVHRLRTSLHERLKVVKKRFFSAFPFYAFFMRFMWSKWKKSAFLEKSGFMPF